MKDNLFENWLEIELRSRKLGEVLDELNKSCGTKYQHNWPSMMKSRGYSLDRLTKNVRQYMMSVVLAEFCEQNNIDISEKLQNKFIKVLT